MGSRDPIGKALALLRLMLKMQDSAWGVRELARASDLPPSTVHRLLSVLTKEGLTVKDDTGLYRVGLEFYRMAWQIDPHYPIRTLAAGPMRELVDSCDESSLLGLYSPQRMEMIFAAMVDSSHPVRYVLPLNEWVPVYASASGLAIMAYLPKPQRKQIIERTRLAPLTEFSITDPGVLEAELAQIRSRGYACTQGQRTPGAVGIAAPIFLDQEAQVIGDLLLTIPRQRYHHGREVELAKLVKEYADGITEKLGGRPPTQAELDEL